MSKITHKHARERLEDVLDYNDRFDKEDNDALLSDYITQQEKKDKLLDLYKQLVNKNLQINLSVLEKIKEIENETKRN